MAGYDGRNFEGPNGAVVYLQQQAARTARLVSSSGVVASEKGSRALVVSLVTASAGSADQALSESIKTVQVALDLWAVRGVMARTLAGVEDEQVVWWTDPEGKLRSRIWATAHMNPQFEGRVEVRDADGNLTPATPEPVLDWHPSFRFFRLGQATTDLVDAFRNYYLALEAILSTIEPPKMRSDGRLDERETDWLGRALPRAAAIVNFADYVAAGSCADPVDAVRADIYAGARTRTFHAKMGPAVLLPHDDTTRAALQASVTRLRRLYIDLAQAVLGFRSGWGTRIAHAGFRAMATGLSMTQFYATSDPAEDPGIALGDLSNIVKFDARNAEELAREYHSAYIGVLAIHEWPHRSIRQVGSLIANRVGMSVDLEGAGLDIEGLESLECVLALTTRDPAEFGTRYVS